MKRCFWVILCLIGLSFSLWVAACVPQTANEVITVSAAASLQEVLEEVAPTFTMAHPNLSMSYNFGSSGALQQQIEQGAPADVFISAATKQMDALSAKGLILANSRQNLVTNRLVLIESVDSPLKITDLAQLKTADIKHFAIGEFRSVPAGQYAEEALKNLGLLDALKSKFVFGNSVRNVLSAVESGNAELGMVYATDAALSARVKVAAIVPESAHSPIVYPIAAMKNRPHVEAAQTFIRFLKAEAAQQMFENFGFGKA